MRRISNANGFPAAFATELPIIVVGSVDIRGVTQGRIQDGPPVDVWAPGVNVKCSGKDAYTPATKETGTSYAAGTAAGLAAYLLSAPAFQSELLTGRPSQLPEKVKQLMVSLAYKRIPNGDPIIWNGIDSAPENAVACGIDAPRSSSSIPGLGSTHPSARDIHRRGICCKHPFFTYSIITLIHPISHFLAHKRPVSVCSSALASRT